MGTSSKRPRSGKSNRRSNDTTLNFTKKCVQKHYMMHLTGQSNMRYRRNIAEHCTHRKIGWDNVLSGLLILYKVTLQQVRCDLCDLCAMNIDDLDVKRNKPLSKGRKTFATVHRYLLIN